MKKNGTNKSCRLAYERSDQWRVLLSILLIHYSHHAKVFLLLLLSIHFNLLLFAQRPPQRLTVTTTASAPVLPDIYEYITSGRVGCILKIDSAPAYVKVFGRIERMTPTPFTIELNPSDNSLGSIVNIAPGQPYKLDPNSEEIEAFGRFMDANLRVTNIDLSTIRDANGRIKLPDGTYRVCFYGRRTFSDPDGGVFLGSVLGEGCSIFTLLTCTQPPNGVQVITRVDPSVSALILNSLSAGSITTTLQYNNLQGCRADVKVFGSIKRMAPAPFTVSLRPDYQPSKPVTLNAGRPMQLSLDQLKDAFGNLDPGNLVISGIDPTTLTDAANNFKLPDGTYQICFNARYFNNNDLGGNASDPNLGCFTFNVCSQSGTAPQFTQPVNNFSVSNTIPVVRPTSPVSFNWTPPQLTCGLPSQGFVYEFEIRELLDNQTVTDAINNPFVFRKDSLHSNLFLLDTNLYRNVLQLGSRYIMRVRARNAFTTQNDITLENNGYSRIEAFQYGENPNIHTDSLFVLPHPQVYLLPFKERKTDYWDDVYTAYRNHLRGDTLLPVDQYIAFSLMERGIAYNPDAIELLLANNPELARLKLVKLSYKLVMPELPKALTANQKKFEAEHALSLKPDERQVNRFRKYLDSLRQMDQQQKLSGEAAGVMHELATLLNGFNKEVDTVNRFTLGIINDLIAEFMYHLQSRSSSRPAALIPRLQEISATIRELTYLSPSTTSFVRPFSYNKNESLSSIVQQRTISPYSIQQALIRSGYPVIQDENGQYFIANLDQLLPVDVLVYHYTAGTPPKPVLNAPDENNIYRIFYTVPVLYNAKNPNIQVKSAPTLASTTRVSLPVNSGYVFWALNMLTHKETKPQNIDTKDIFLNAKKRYTDSKRLSIILKVDK